MSTGKLVIYAGAGISLAQPTSLPTGAQLASAIHLQLKAAFHVLEAVEASDLLAVADAVAALPGGEEALRRVSARSADFQTAKPGYAHKVLAHLMLEGAIDVITTNWDNCIERGAGEERLPTITDSHELAHVSPPWVLKVHGCASKPDSLLLSSDHLDNPPQWVHEQTHARLGSAVVVFIGIGDVAGYVRRRITEAIHEVGSVENIRVVAPGIVANWEDSQWETVAPDLAEDHKIPATADHFMEKLASAYIMGRLGEHSLSLSSDEDLAADFAGAQAAILRSEPLTILQWVRTVDINPQPGEAVLKSSELGKALVALGHLAGQSAQLQYNHIFDTAQGPVEVLIATQTVSARRLFQAAENRLHDHASRGEAHPMFIVAGGIGRVPKPDFLPDSILGDTDDMDIVDGPTALLPNIRHADEVLVS